MLGSYYGEARRRALQRMRDNMRRRGGSGAASGAERHEQPASAYASRMAGRGRQDARNRQMEAARREQDRWSQVQQDRRRRRAEREASQGIVRNLRGYRVT